MLKEKGSNLYTVDGRIAVDRICLFEDLATELEHARRKIGIPEPLDMPAAKSGYRTDKRSYRDILSDDDRARIAASFQDEIDRCEYRF